VVVSQAFEAAWQAARLGAQVRLYEMRPSVKRLLTAPTNLPRSFVQILLSLTNLETASFLLKEELRRGGSLVMDVAAATRVPAGAALAVDREKFAELITQRIESEPRIELIRDEVTTTK
jgi:methylenetetrahydrofolate--tRNA-(uracil-5-)-methyltransferase